MEQQQTLLSAIVQNGLSEDGCKFSDKIVLVQTYNLVPVSKNFIFSSVNIKSVLQSLSMSAATVLDFHNYRFNLLIKMHIFIIIMQSRHELGFIHMVLLQNS